MMKGNLCTMFFWVLFGMGLMLLGSEASAHHCKGKHADDPACGEPPPPSPDVCMDDFPSFVYIKPANRGPDELRVSSSEGCRTELLANVNASRGPAFSYNNGRGLVAWTEDYDNYDITILRFSYDLETDLTVDLPQTVLTTQRPSDTEYFFDIDTWVDYSSETETDYVELIALYRLTVSDSRRSIEILDLASCSPECSSDEILASPPDQQTCIRDAGGFDGSPELFPDCFRPSSVSFNPTGDALFVGVRALEWRGILRVGITDNSGWASTSPPEFVVVHNVTDCEVGAVPASWVNVGTVFGREVIAATACFGFQARLRDDRIYFLDVPECILDPRDWQACQPHGKLRSGEFNGRGPSWLASGEILYSGFTSKTLNSLRVFDPDVDNSSNDREVIKKNAESGDTGL